MSSTSISQTKFTTLAASGSTATVSLPIVGVLEVDVFTEDAPTWGSGTLKLQMSPDGGTTWLDVSGASWTSGGGRLTSAGAVKVIGASAFKLVLSGATSPSITPNLVVRRSDFRSVQSASFAADGTSASFFLQPLPDQIGVCGFGTFGSGTIKLQVSPDNGTTWYTVQSKTANDYTRIDFVREGLYRFVLSGSTNPVLTVSIA